MKSFALAAALLASAAIAQPHGHQHHDRRGKQHAHEHDKRALVVEVETAWVTATVIIGDDSTSTIVPTNTGGEFFEPSSTAAPVAAPTTLIPQVAPAPSPSTQTPPPPPPPSPTPEPTPEPTTIAPEVTTTAAPVVVTPSIVAEAPVVAPTTTSAAPQQPPASSGGGSSSGGGGGSHSATKTGDITFYDLGQGACGYDDSDVNNTGFVAAISADFWNSISTLTNSGVNSPTNPLCNKKVTLIANGKSVEVTARDKCPGCSSTAIDVSKAAFIALFGDLGVGRSTVTWSISW